MEISEKLISLPAQCWRRSSVIITQSTQYIQKEYGFQNYCAGATFIASPGIPAALVGFHSHDK